MEIKKSKKPGLNAFVLICLFALFLSSALFIGFISTMAILRLGNISVSVAEKDITAEYIEYVAILMEKKSKEYSHLFELGVTLAAICANQSAFIYENIDKFDIDEQLLKECRNSFIKDRDGSCYLNKNDGIINLLPDRKAALSKENLKIYYALSFFDPLIRTVISNSKYLEYFNLMVFDLYYEVFFDRKNTYDSFKAVDSGQVMQFMDRAYSKFLSTPLPVEVDYHLKSMNSMSTITCAAKYFNKESGKLDLASTIGIDIDKLTKDIEDEEINIFNSWKGLDLSESARDHIFTFVLDTRTCEIVIIPKKTLELMGFNESSLMEKNKKEAMTIFPYPGIYTYDSANPALRTLQNKTKNTQKGQFHITLESIDYLFIYQKMTYGNWALFTAVPYSIFLQPAVQAKKSMQGIIYDFNKDFVFISIIFFAATAVITVYLFRRYILLPIRGFSERALEMSKGNFGVTVIARGGREIHDLGISFNQLSGELRKYMKNLECELESQSNLESEMDIARKIQQSLLPRWDLFFEDNRFSLFCELIPAKEVAGDFYDLFMLNENNLMFLVADVSGKGISAAFFMSIAKSVIRNSCINKPDNPAVAMREANEILSQYGTEMFVTVFLCYIDLNTGAIKYANAGHNEALMLAPDGSTRYFGKLGNAVAGFIGDLDFALGEDVINYGETLILYTDGITEATSPSEELFEEERLAEIVSINHDSELKDIVSEIIHAVELFDNSVQFDDITVITFRRNRL